MHIFGLSFILFYLNLSDGTGYCIFSHIWYLSSVKYTGEGVVLSTLRKKIHPLNLICTFPNLSIFNISNFKSGNFVISSYIYIYIYSVCQFSKKIWCSAFLAQPGKNRISKNHLRPLYLSKTKQKSLLQEILKRHIRNVTYIKDKEGDWLVTQTLQIENNRALWISIFLINVFKT